MNDWRSQRGNGSVFSGESAIPGAIDKERSILRGWPTEEIIKDEGNDEISPLLSLGDRTSLDGKDMQVAFVSKKTYTDLHVYLDELASNWPQPSAT